MPDPNVQANAESVSVSISRDGQPGWANAAEARARHPGTENGHNPLQADAGEPHTSQEHFRTLADIAPAMLWVTDASNRCVFLSRGWYDYTGQTEGEGFGWLQSVHPEDRDEASRRFLTAAAERQPFSLDFRLRRGDGECRWAIDQGQPRFGEHGEWQGYVGSVIDDHDRIVATEALRRSEERYRTLFESMDEGFCILQLIFDEEERPIDYRYLEINPVFERQTGMKNALGRTVRELVPEIEPFWFGIYGRVALTGEPVRFVDHAESMSRWFDVYAFRIGAPELRQVAVLFSDITECRRAEQERERLLQAALRSEERYTLVNRATNDVIWDWDLATNELTWNEAIETMFGYAPAEVPPTIEFWYDHIHPDDRERVTGSIHAVIDGGGTTWSGEYRFRRVDGSYATVLDRGVLARNDSGRATRMIGSLLDISERERLLASERLARADAEQAAQVMSLINTHLADGVCMMDAQGRLTYMNPAVERILGWTREELEGKILHDMVHYKHPDGRPFPMHECPLGRVLSAAEPMLGMADQWVHKDGSFVHLVTTCSPLVSDGRIIGAVLSMHDDTERRQAEAERERLLQAEQAARAEAEAANRAKADFLASMSHELRTPLNAIGGYVELLDIGIHGPLTDAQREALSRVTANQRHLLTLINDVLAFAKMEAGQVEFHLRPLTACDLLAGVEPLVAPLAQSKGIALSVQECDPALQVIGDEERVRQIMLNLVGNAIKFTPEGGWVLLGCEPKEEWIHIQVRDNGPGVSAEKQQRIFDPFVQADRRLNRPQEGVGLGLAISRDLARAMGGELSMESAPGEGSTFTLRLPQQVPAKS